MDENKIQSVVIEILQDSLADTKKVIKRLQATVILLIVLIVGISIYYEWSFKHFINQYDFESPITTTNDLINENATMSNINIENNIPKK